MIASPGAERLEQVQAVRRAFARDVRKRRGKLVGGSLFAVVYALARVVEPWPLKVVFDQVLFHKPATGALVQPFLALGHSPHDILAAAAIVLAVSGLVRGVSYYYEDYLLSSAAQEIVYGIRTRLYRHLHALPLSFHQRRRTGDLLVRLSADIILLRDVLIDFIVNLGSGAVLIVLMVAVMFVVDPLLTVVSLAVMPLIVGLSWLYGRRIRRNAHRQRKREGEVASVMHESLAAMSVVQLHGAEGREQDRFHQINRRSLKQGVKGARLEAKMNREVELALAGGTVVVLWAGTLRALHGAITPGELIVFVSYMRAAYRPLRRASKSVQRSAKALSAAERIVEILDTKPELADAPDAVEAGSLRGEVTFEHVDFGYRPGQRVLQDVTFTAAPGKRVAVVGATGSGKSTLLSLIPRLFDVSAGRVLIDGRDVRDYTLESLRSQVSVVQQEAILFGLSVAENIRYGCPEATDEEVRAAASAAGMDEFVERLPDGYDTVLAERGASLSGGQRQRVAIARALVRRSPILVLDEPTTGLDAATQRGILDALRALMDSTTTLLVTHDMDLVREADEIIVLQDGRVVDRGGYDELLRRTPAFARLVRRAASKTGARIAPSGPSSGDGPRVLFYSHNGVGVGHLQRQLDLAKAFRHRHPDAAVLVATGSHAAGMFTIPSGVDYLKLPSIAMVDRYENWDPRELPVPREEVVGLRSELLERAASHFAPDLLVADFMPAGPYGELLPALETLAARGGAAVAGFRDVIDEPKFVRELWRRTGVLEVLRESYAAICVYGDRGMVDFAREYGLDAELAARLNYCGYLGRSAPEAIDAPVYERPLVVASAGGGVDGPAVLEAFVRAAEWLRGKRAATFLMVTGPLMSSEEHRRLTLLGETAGVMVRRSLPDLRAHVALADCVVGMAGYNTCCDILSFRRPAIIVPRHGRSREQTIRAQRFAAWGSAQVLDAGELDSGRLAAAIEVALDGPPPSAAPVSLAGLDAAVDVFDAVLAATQRSELPAT
ncbi:MAG TPA: ABC transporter transmembrane domain-containing protein [Thermoleophilaceae bacterium]|nr:ABC transporter transmembrane domain-containing protein [Thermoleophilaceae bacterium]